MATVLDYLRATRRLHARIFAAWAFGSLVGGAVLWWPLRSEAVWGAVAMEFAIWGAINACFAVPGLRQVARADRTLASPEAEEAEVKDARALLAALKVSGRLNYLWIGIGLALLVWAGWAQSAALLGHGVGVLAQGAFLLLFDRHLAREISAVASA